MPERIETWLVDSIVPEISKIERQSYSFYLTVIVVVVRLEE